MVLNNDIEIEIINPGETEPIIIEPDSWSLKRYRDANRASEFNFKCSRSVPISKMARINSVEGGDVRFLGYAKVSGISWPSRREISCKGLEELLWHRYTHRWSYLDRAYHFLHPFQSDAPSQTYDEYDVAQNNGLLFIANSRIPAYLPFGKGSYTYRYDGWGKNSVVGVKDIYLAGELMPRVADYVTLQATSPAVYADDNDLYVRNQANSFGLGGFQTAIDALNAFDTGVRCGTIDGEDQQIQGHITFAFNRIGDFLVNFAETYGRYVSWDYRKDRLCYLNVLDDPASVDFDICEGDIDDFSQKNAGTIKPTCLIGVGVGSKDCAGIYCKNDPTQKGLWYMDVYQVPDNRGWMDATVSGDEFNLTGPIYDIVDGEYANRQDDDIYEITTSRWPHRPKPWDRVNLAMNMEAVKALSVASVKIDNKKKLVLELGGRRSEIMDAWNAKSALENMYLYNYLKEVKTPLSSSGTIIIGDATHGFCAGYSASLTVPADVAQADLSHRVTLDITLDPNSVPAISQIYVTVNGGLGRFCEMPHYYSGDAINMIDITSLVNYGSASTFAVFVKIRAEWAASHTACSGHPVGNITLAVRSWKRISLE